MSRPFLRFSSFSAVFIGIFKGSTGKVGRAFSEIFVELDEWVLLSTVHVLPFVVCLRVHSCTATPVKDIRMRWKVCQTVHEYTNAHYGRVVYVHFSRLGVFK